MFLLKFKKWLFPLLATSIPTSVLFLLIASCLIGASWVLEQSQCQHGGCDRNVAHLRVSVVPPKGQSCSTFQDVHGKEKCSASLPHPLLLFCPATLCSEDFLGIPHSK